jgi:tRNA A37 threonylcarbamoyladenosine modification protein TsaB
LVLILLQTVFKNMFLAIQTVRVENQVLLLNEQFSVLAEKSWESKNDQAAKLLPSIEEMLTLAKLNYRDISKIIIVNGLGAFSSTRIGVNVANTLAYLTGAPLLAMTIAKDDQRNFKELLEKFLKSNPAEQTIVSPVYATEPTITPSKKNNLI